MRKKENEAITNDETKVLVFLEQNAKKSIDEIAKQCGFSRQKVWRIVKHLEEQEIIWGYTAVTDGSVRGLKHFMVLVKRNSLPFDQEMRKEMLFSKLDNFPPGLVKIENIYFTHGTADWVLTFYALDIITAKKYVEHTFERLNKYLQEYTILETLVPFRKMGLKNPHIEAMLQFI
jgi:Lrp/AsnC family transcriptional regulator, leucine-responsive regulatory protein